MRRLFFLLALLFACRTRGTPPAPEPPPEEIETPAMETIRQEDLGERVNLPPAALSGGSFVVVTVSGRGIVLDVNGNRREIFNVNEPPTAGPVVNGDSVIFGTFYGNLYVFDTIGNLLFRDSLTYPIRGIAVAGIPVIVCDDGRVVGYNDTGRAWVRFAGDNVQTSPSVVSGAFVITTVSGRVLAYDSSGNLLWMYEGVGTIPTNPSALDSMAVAGFPDGKVAFLTSSGYTEINLPSGAIGEITAAGGRAYASTYSGRIFGFTPGGDIGEVYADSLWLPSSPVPGDSGLLVLDGNGKVYFISYDGDLVDTLRLGEGDGWTEPLVMDTLLVAVSRDGKVYVVRVSGFSLRGGWPLFRGNPHRSGTPYP